MIVACAKCGARNRVDAGAAAGQGRQPVCGRCGARLELTTTTNDDGKPLTVTDVSFDRDVLAGDVPVLLDCWAAWCAPCRMIAPVLDELARESAGRYRIAKLDVDGNPRTAARFQVSSIPTLLIFKRGALVDRLVGAQPKSAIAARLAAHA